MTSKRLSKLYIMIASILVAVAIFTTTTIIAVMFAAALLLLRLLGKAKTALKENGKR